MLANMYLYTRFKKTTTSKLADLCIRDLLIPVILSIESLQEQKSLDNKFQKI